MKLQTLLFFHEQYQQNYCMSKAKQKELQQLREEKQKKQNQYRHALKHLINENERMQIILDYSENYLKNTVKQPLEEYSPIHISRLVFEQQLQAIKHEIQKLPNHQCRIEHFIILMLKVMKFPFQKVPLYMIGLKDIFHQIADDGKDVITFDAIFKYIVGEFITMKQEEQNTQFHIQFEEKKRQDFLLHDNGIKRILFSNDLKVLISLDNRQNLLKIYDQDMRNINRFESRKQFHNGKNPIIIDFDYSEMTMRLGIIFADRTIQSIHLPNFLNKSQAEFQTSTLNQLLFVMPERMDKIYYIHMLNKWLTFSTQTNNIYLFDMEKIRLKPQQVLEKVNISTNQLNISSILQIVTLSTICVVAGNEISFYNENLAAIKFAKFSHHEIISVLKYSAERNIFFLVGQYEKAITMFTINRNKTSFKIWNFQINRVIIDFQIFPFYDTILICDQTHQIRLIHQPSKTTYKQQSYAHIAKIKDQNIQCYKLSKSQFMIYQTYMISLAQEKIAIEKELQYNFLPYFYYDHKKEEFYFSMNDQLISFSVLFGQIRKNFSGDSSNINKHLCFFLGNKTHPFIFDKNKNLYEVYLKSEEIEGQNKSYRKKLPISQPIGYFYDEQMRNFMIMTNNSVFQVRNDFHNNFNTINIINLIGFPKIQSATFCNKSKYLTFFTSDFLLYQFKNFETHMRKCFKFTFERQKNDAVEGNIVDFHYSSELEIFILLNNKNELVIVQRLNLNNYVFINLKDYLPYKLKQLNFTKLVYSLFKQKIINNVSILLKQQGGFLLDLNIYKIIVSRFANTTKEETQIKSFLKESYDLNHQNVKKQQISFGASKAVKLSPNQFFLHKVHQKSIAIMTKIKLELIVTLTISQDGYIKLWNQTYQCLSSLKIPAFLKISWNMKQIQDIKNKKSIDQLNQIITKHYSIKNNSIEPLQSLKKIKKFKHYQTQQPPKKFKFEDPLPLQIDSKEIQDILLKQEDYRKDYLTSRSYKPRQRYNPQISTIDGHPWRTKRQFVKIYQKASPKNKYTNKIPRDLLTLRVSLDMSEKRKKQPNYKIAEHILPQLKSYQYEAKVKIQKPQGTNQQQKQQVENFESCFYVKSGRRKKKANEFDQIDRQFIRKQIQMQNRRIKNKFQHEKKYSGVDMTQSLLVTIEDNRYDTIRDIQSVFEQHNKECVENRRGRIIRIPKINVCKDYQ